MDITQSFQLDVQDSCKDSDALVMAQFKVVWNLNVVFLNYCFPSISKPGDILFCWINTVIYWVGVWLDNKTCFVLEYWCHLLVNLCHCALRTKPNLELFLSFSVTLLWLDTPAYKVTTCMPVSSHYFQHRSAHSLFSPFSPERPAEKAFTESCSGRAGLTGGCSGLCHWGFSTPFRKEKYWSEQRTPNTKASLRHHLFLGIGECRLQRDPALPGSLYQGPL